MRKFLIVLAALALVIGCGSAKVRMNNYLEKAHIGMSVEEFKKIASQSILMQAIDEFSCYKLEEQSPKFGVPGGYVYERRFSYFKNNKLYRIDEGTRPTDLKIEISKDINITNN